MSCWTPTGNGGCRGRVANDEAALLDLIADVADLADNDAATWAIDLNSGGAALLLALLVNHEQRLLYIPGGTVYHAAASYRGDGKTNCGHDGRGVLPVAGPENRSAALYSDSLVQFAQDPWFCLPVMAAVIAGGLGFPALMELRRRYRMPRRWSMHTKVTLGTSVVLLAIGSVAILVAEWANPATLGPLGVPGKLLSGVFHRMTPRPSGFATLDMAEMRPESILVTDVLMFIGGAGTAPVPLGG